MAGRGERQARAGVSRQGLAGRFGEHEWEVRCAVQRKWNATRQVVQDAEDQATGSAGRLRSEEIERQADGRCCGSVPRGKVRGSRHLYKGKAIEAGARWERRMRKARGWLQVARQRWDDGQNDDERRRGLMGYQDA